MELFMENVIVEVGFKLNQTLDFYIEMLEKKELKLMFNCITHDKYYTKTNLNGLSEAEIKKSCVRIRKIYKINEKIKEKKSFKEIKLLLAGYKKIIDTKKVDYQYGNENMKSRIQLQNIDNIGLLVYYDNPDYYDLTAEEQRKKLIDDLNNYGFNINYNELGLDKLRTLYYKEEKFSLNQSDQIVTGESK